MIWESHYWKDDLIKLADSLGNGPGKRGWSERALVNLEKKVFTAFYSIRKLMEAKKLTDKVMKRTVALKVHESAGKQVTLLNWHKIDRLYQLDKFKTVNKPLKFLCDQFIHSYVYVPLIDEKDRLQSLMVASDRVRNSGLFVLDLPKFLRILREVGNCYPASMHYNYDVDIKDYKVQSE